EKSTPATVAAITAEYHLKDPIYIQYFYYMSEVLRGDLGISPLTHLTVIHEMAIYFPATLELSLAALIISVIIGIPIGVLSAVWNGRKLDQPLRVLYLSGIASPPFLLALLLQLLFSYYLKVLPSSGEL